MYAEAWSERPDGPLGAARPGPARDPRTFEPAPIEFIRGDRDIAFVRALGNGSGGQHEAVRLALLHFESYVPEPATAPLLAIEIVRMLRTRRG